MEPRRNIGGPRPLLPYEAELCNALGITTLEYFQFLEGVETKIKERSEAYGIVPDIVNMPQTLPFLFTAGGTALSIWGQIAVSVALSAVAYLLTPKPKTPETPGSVTVGGVQGRSRFSPQSSFDSVQDLAVLGTFIPLVYARKRTIGGFPSGGVRVNSQLLWSSMKTTGSGEILSVIGLFSNGELGSKPDYKTFALGTNLIRDFSAEKIALFFNRGRTNGRINASDRYTESEAPDGHNLEGRGVDEFSSSDPFAFRELTTPVNHEQKYIFEEYFSSVRTDQNKSQFGAHSPIPNGMAYKTSWELVQLMGEDEIKTKNKKKMEKINYRYPRYCALTNFENGGYISDKRTVSKGQTLVYRIWASTTEAAFEGADTATDYDRFNPWGSKDARDSINTIRTEVDDILTIGDQFLIGTALATLKRADHGSPWSPERRFTKSFIFEVDEPGEVEFQPLSRGTSGPGNGEGSIATESGLKDPATCLTLQKVAIAAVSNTRASLITEIGLKSTVYRKINGAPNISSVPSRTTVGEHEQNNVPINVGSVNKFTKRFSFFRLQLRRKNQDEDYRNVMGDRILGIKGLTPTAQYNTLQLKTNGEQYDYRFLPVSGNYVLTNVLQHVYILRHNGYPQKVEYLPWNLEIFFNGDLLTLPASQDVYKGNSQTNSPEWIGDFYLSGVGGGPVTDLNRYNNGVTDPSSFAWVLQSAANGGNDYGQKNNWRGPGTGSPSPGAYFNTNNGVVCILVENPSQWKWYFIYGGTEIPVSEHGKPIVTSPNVYPTNTYKYARDSRDNVRRRFKIASTNHVQEDANGRRLFAMIKEKESIATYTESTSTSTAERVKVKNTNAAGLVVNITTRTPNGGGSVYKEWTIRHAGSNYNIDDRVSIAGGSITLRIEGVDISGSSSSQSSSSSVSGVTGYVHSELQSSNYSDPEGLRSFETYWRTTNTNPNTAIADYFLYDTESSSHESSPEHEVVFINEVEHSSATYSDLAMAGLRINSTQEIQTLNSFSAIIKDGIKVDRLIDNNGTGKSTAKSLIDSTDNFVEVAHDLLTNDMYGAGSHIGYKGVNRDEMIEAAKYCLANGFTWNGIIDKRFNLREFIYEHAGYNLLDFSIKGGLFGLRPGYPTNPDNSINYDASTTNGINIRGLFSDGNMRNLQVSFLSPEERNMFKATVITRKDDENGFPEPEVNTYGYAHDSSQSTLDYLEKLPEEVFDLSNWCVNVEHGHRFAAIALATRKEVDHGISFETVPSSVLGLAAGDYIRVISEATHTSRFNNGSIDDAGFVTSARKITGTINIYYWQPSSLGGIRSGTLTVSGGKATNGLKSVLFAQIDTTAEDRLYKIESISYGEEGFIKVAASHAPLTSNNKLAVLYRAGSTYNLETYFPSLG